MTAQITPFPGYGSPDLDRPITDADRDAFYCRLFDALDSIGADADPPQLYRCIPVQTRPCTIAELFSAASTVAVIFAMGWVAGLLTIIAILH